MGKFKKLLSSLTSKKVRRHGEEPGKVEEHSVYDGEKKVAHVVTYDGKTVEQSVSHHLQKDGEHENVANLGDSDAQPMAPSVIANEMTEGNDSEIWESEDADWASGKTKEVKAPKKAKESKKPDNSLFKLVKDPSETSEGENHDNIREAKLSKSKRVLRKAKQRLEKDVIQLPKRESTGEKPKKRGRLAQILDVYKFADANPKTPQGKAWNNMIDDRDSNIRRGQAMENYIQAHGEDKHNHYENMKELYSLRNASDYRIPGTDKNVSYLGAKDGHHYFSERGRRQSKFFVVSGDGKQITHLPNSDTDTRKELPTQIKKHPAFLKLRGKEARPVADHYLEDFLINREGNNITIAPKTSKHRALHAEIDPESNTVYTKDWNGYAHYPSDHSIINLLNQHPDFKDNPLRYASKKEHEVKTNALLAPRRLETPAYAGSKYDVDAKVIPLKPKDIIKKAKGKPCLKKNESFGSRVAQSFKNVFPSSTPDAPATPPPQPPPTPSSPMTVSPNNAVASSLKNVFGGGIKKSENKCSNLIKKCKKSK